MLFALCLAGVAGCGPWTGGRMAVTGTVALDGEPVDWGSIVFVPAEGGDGGQKAGGRIENGKYALPAVSGLVPGKYRVEIRWDRKTGRQIRIPGQEPDLMDETRQVVPARYNTKSDLIVDLQQGRNTLDFDLRSK
jgi:hypothetical protein